MKKAKNFARFYALFRQIPDADTGLKESYVKTYTNGRETSLTEMFQHEYKRLCDDLEIAVKGKPVADHQAELRSARSAFLKRLTKMGYDTTNWSEVDKFCLETRNIGKRFAHLSIAELKRSIPVLEAIRKKKEKAKAGAILTISPKAAAKLVAAMSNQIPS